MKKAVQRVISVSVLCLMVLMLLTKFGAQETGYLPEETGTLSADVQTIEAEETAQMPSEEELMPVGIVIDFPFPATRDAVYEDAELILVCVDESAGTYELRLYDRDENIMQQIPCGKLTEPVSFFYSDLTSDGYEDLEIFSSESQSMLLFISDYRMRETGKLFLDEAAEIPITDVYGRIVLGVVDDLYDIETVYERNKEKNDLTARGSLKLQKWYDTLEIWDYLENKSIFEGKVALQEDGSLVNEEYYQYLCWGNLYRLWEGSEDSIIRVWVSETEKEGESGEQNGFEWAQEVVWGNTGHQTEYENRRTYQQSKDNMVFIQWHIWTKGGVDKWRKQGKSRNHLMK